MTRDYPCVADIIVLLQVQMRMEQDKEKMWDWDELVYDAISEWDQVFEDDEDWFSEEGSDIKDQLRDQVLAVVAK
tara:strand:+ start:546 stop:770 length:225 start_codon:yes stop_codon:yes gene_type:complete